MVESAHDDQRHFHDMTDAYQRQIEAVYSALGTSRDGLSESEAQARLARQGSNLIAGRKRATAFGLFFRQFLNPLVYLLVGAATLKAVVKGPVDALTIVGVLLFMAIVGFIQEFRAGKAMDALLQLAAPRAKVRRNGQLAVIEARELVAGDVVVLDAGDQVPADARLIEAVDLKVNESSLTGESLPTNKQTERIDHEVPLGERKNMIYSGTPIVLGRGQAVVTATGMRTEIGRIAAAVRGITQGKTSLQKSIDQLGHSLVWIVLGVCVVLITLGLWNRLSPVDVLMLAVAAAVAGIPEGLPAVVTVVLATGMQRMARHSAIVRKLIAVETLGSTTVICSDKTGTLTLNQMTVQTIFADGQMIEVSGQGYRPDGGFSSGGMKVTIEAGSTLDQCLRVGLLCNDAIWRPEGDGYAVVGDPTEAALIVAAAKAGMDKAGQEARYPRRQEIPFQSQRQYMATSHGGIDAGMVCVKGSLERLLPMAGRQMRQGRSVELTEADRAEWLAAAESMGGKAMRVLAIATAENPVDGETLSEQSLQGRLSMVGLCGMIDPPRQEAKEAIASCHRGGIRVVMVTGDNIHTGQAIASELGIRGRLSMSGTQLAEMSDEQLHQTVEDTGVFARIEPLHKLRIVRAFQNRGHVVAMTGDGVNDAPALEAADIGVAMGITGTDVAKESADMVLADDNFATIVTAVEEGRAIFQRLRNVVFFLMTTCFGELLSLTLAMAFVGEASLVPLQILWINLVTGALVAIPLGLEPQSGEELDWPPRDPKVGLLYPGMLLRIGALSSLLGIGALMVFVWTLRHYEIHEARTMTFCSIVAFEWFLALNARSDRRTVFQLGLFGNPWLWVTLGAGFVLQGMVIYTPFFHRFFDTVSLRPFEWGIAILPGLLIFAIETLRKRIAPGLFSAGQWSRSYAG